MTGGGNLDCNSGQSKACDSNRPARDPDGIGCNEIVRQLSYSLFRHGKRLAGKSAAGLRGRWGGGGTGRAPGSETMTLR